MTCWNPHIVVNQFLCCISLESGSLDLWENILKVMDCSQLHFVELASPNHMLSYASITVAEV